MTDLCKKGCGKPVNNRHGICINCRKGPPLKKCKDCDHMIRTSLRCTKCTKLRKEILKQAKQIETQDTLIIRL